MIYMTLYLLPEHKLFWQCQIIFYTAGFPKQLKKPP